MINEYVREYKIGSGSYGKVVSMVLTVFDFKLFKDMFSLHFCLGHAIGFISKPQGWESLCN